MNTIAIEKKHIFLVAVLVLTVFSFFGEWIDAKHFSFVSYSYFLITLYLVRCYLFCLLTIGFLALCKNKISLVLESAIFSPVVIGAIFILLRFPFNTMTLYSRITTVVQIITVILIFGKTLILFYEKHFSANQENSEQAQNTITSNQTQISNTQFPNDSVHPQTSAPDFSKLSRREKDVAVLILEGKKNDEIAEELFISAATVKSHIQHIFEKYEVRNRMEFANKVIKK